MKKILIILVVIFVLGYFTKPPKKEIYNKILETEFNMGDAFLPKVKYKAIESMYQFDDIYCGMIIRNNEDDESLYIAAFNQVFAIKSKERMPSLIE